MKQIMQQCLHIFSVSNVYKYVDIWHPSVASEPLFTISTIFEDANISQLDMEEPEDFDVEDSPMAAISLEL